jgi:hypothetical protein
MKGNHELDVSITGQLNEAVLNGYNKNLIPPSGYSDRLPVLERVFASGVAPYVQPTGFDAYRVITGVDKRSEEIDPFQLRFDASRMQHSGDPRLFTTDRKPEAFAETLGHTGDGIIPPGTFEIGYYVTGLTLNHNLIKDLEYRELCFNPDGHPFTQSISFYLQNKGYNTQYDTHSWPSVAGAAHGISGFVHAFQRFGPTVIRHSYTKPL